MTRQVRGVSFTASVLRFIANESYVDMHMTVNASLIVSGYAMTWLASYMGSPETDQFTAVHAGESSETLAW